MSSIYSRVFDTITGITISFLMFQILSISLFFKSWYFSTFSFSLSRVPFSTGTQMPTILHFLSPLFFKKSGLLVSVALLIGYSHPTSQLDIPVLSFPITPGGKCSYLFLSFLVCIACMSKAPASQRCHVVF